MSEKKAPTDKEPQAEKKTDKTGQIPDEALDKATGGAAESLVQPPVEDFLRTRTRR
jgi:hypothetical protein